MVMPRKHFTVEAKRQAKRASARRFALANPEHVKLKNSEWHYKNKYGVTLAQRDALLAKQGGRCALPQCRREIVFAGKGYKAAHLDHDHVSGKVRGVLCGGCNTALGKLGDTREAIEGVLAYLTGEDFRG